MPFKRVRPVVDDLTPVNSDDPQTIRRIACWAVLLCLIVILAGCGGGSSSPSPTPTPTPDGSFAPAASLPTMNQARYNATATLLPNGKLLIAGGISLSHTGSLASLGSVELYDPATNSFAPPASTPTMNQARDSATATLLPNGKVLIAGGESLPGDGSRISLASVELYDPATNSFAPPASTPMMNQARTSGAAAVSLFNGNVLIAGGEGPVGFPANIVSLGTIELYDTATNTFASAASLPEMNELRFQPTGTLLPNGEVLIAGGLERLLAEAFIISNTVDLYDPVTNSFAPAASTPTMNSPRWQAAAALLPNGTVLIAGGGAPAPNLGPGGVSLASVDLYDSATNSFAPAAATPTMNEPRGSSPTATLLPNGKVLITQGAADNSIDLYDSTTNTFAPAALLPRMNQTRVSATATLLPNGKVLIAGGTTSGGPSNTIDLYTP